MSEQTDLHTCHDHTLAELLETVLVGTAAVVGEDYYRALVTTLATAFRVRYAVIGRLTPDGQDVRTLAVCADGRIADNLTYPLQGTPCSQVIGREPQYFQAAVAELFPEDQLLRELEVECYLGVPLYAANGQPLGNLLLMHSCPLPETEVVLAMKLIGLFALRTAGEIERLEREQLLRLREIQLGVMSGISHDGMLVCDGHGVIQAANPAYCAMLGYAEHELQGRHIREMEASESSAEVLDHTAKIIEQGFDRFVSRHRCKDGSAIDLELSVSYSPETNRFFSVARDITDRLQLEQKLRESEQRYQVLTEISADFFHACLRRGDLPYRVQWIGGQFEKISGYSVAELLDVGCWLSFVHLDDRPRIAADLESLVPGQIHRREFRLVRKDGSLCWISEASRCERDPADPDLLWLYGTCRDITERKQADQRLAESEQRFRSLVEQVPGLAVQGYDRERRVIFWNQASERLYGYKREEALGRQLEELIIQPEMRTAVIEAVRAWLDEGVAIPAGELQLMRKDGTEVPVFSSHVMQINSRGEYEMYCLDLDLTELKQAQQAAEAASRVKSEFLANMSHEVRTPLNGIMGMAQLLRMTSLTDEQERFLAMLDDSSRTLLTLLNDILDISRIEAGRMTIEMLPFSLPDLLEQTLQLHRASADQKGLTLDCLVDPSLPSDLLGDPLRIKQILLNLVGNAVKFTSRGGVSLNVTRTGGGGSDCLLVKVSDSGIGISAEALERIFDQFTQADTSTARLYGGSGLGLAICQRLAGLMGGRIWAKSSLGQGSSFYLELPLRVAEKPALRTAAAAQAATPAVALPPLRILLVEDQEVSRKFAMAILERAGHLVTPALDGLMALALLEHEPFDLVLLDIQMPGMGGEEVLTRLRGMQHCSSLPVIALTAHALAGDREHLLRCGFDGYSPKPLEVAALHGEIARVLVQKSPLQRNHNDT